VCRTALSFLLFFLWFSLITRLPPPPPLSLLPSPLLLSLFSSSYRFPTSLSLRYHFHFQYFLRRVLLLLLRLRLFFFISLIRLIFHCFLRSISISFIFWFLSSSFMPMFSCFLLLHYFLIADFMIIFIRYFITIFRTFDAPPLSLFSQHAASTPFSSTMMRLRQLRFHWYLLIFSCMSFAISHFFRLSLYFPFFGLITSFHFISADFIYTGFQLFRIIVALRLLSSFLSHFRSLIACIDISILRHRQYFIFISIFSPPLHFFIFLFWYIFDTVIHAGLFLFISLYYFLRYFFSSLYIDMTLNLFSIFFDTLSHCFRFSFTDDSFRFYSFTFIDISLLVHWLRLTYLFSLVSLIFH